MQRLKSKPVAIGIGVVVAVVVAMLAGRALADDDGEAAAEVIVPRPVERRTLTDTLTVSGELRREELQTINSAVDGKVSSVQVTDGDTVDVGGSLFDLDGRSAVAVDGEFAFFRTLDVGSDGPDVEQLERILTDQGYSVGSVDRLFTESTRSGLAQWQFDQGYGGFTPEPDEAVTIALSANSAGYDVGAQNSIAVVIGPSVPSGSGVFTGGSRAMATLASMTSVAAGPAKPVITVAVSPAAVDEGGSMTFTFTAAPAPTTNLTIDLTVGGDATGGEERDDADYQEIRDTFVFPAGKTTHSIQVKTFNDGEIESAEEVEVELSQQFNDTGFYVVGPINQAIGVIRANGENVRPVLTVESDSDLVGEGEEATITIEADAERNEDYDIPIFVRGQATSGRDFATVDDTVTMTAGSTSATVTVSTRQDDQVESDESVTVSLGTGSEFLLGSPSSARFVIESEDLPELSLVGGGTVGEGGTATFTIVSDQRLVEATSVNYQISGSAQAGEDFDTLTGTVVMPAGSTSVSVPIRTVDDDVVFLPSDMVVADWPAQVGTVSVDDGEFVLQGSPVLTLTEPVFTVNLSVTASDRAELEIGQAVIVDIAVGNQTSEGVISELDDSATVDEAGNELYGGVVEIVDPLTAVDGASVTIDVILDERPDVLVVPVAAVLQQGGERQVRVINDDGTIDRITVEVGLVDDEFIEVTSGLDGDEIVVVSIDEGLDPGVTPVRGQPLLELEQVSRVYGEEVLVYALREVSLTIRAGDFMAIIGPSGSGKSTMLGLLGVLDLPSDGVVRVDGVDVGELDDAGRSRLRGDSVGFVFQQFHLIPHLSAQANVETALLYRNLSRRERAERARDALERVGLGARTDHRPVQMSGGEQQRVALARAIVTDPLLVLADEPTGALDTKNAANVMEIFESLHAPDRAIVMVTHDLAVADHAERRVSMRDGEIVADEVRSRV